MPPRSTIKFTQDGLSIVVLTKKESMDITTGQATIHWTNSKAIEYIESFGEGENATDEEKMQAWAYIIRTGYAWSLQGFYGREAKRLINEGYISEDEGIILKQVN